jgi:hypothetical protein
MTRRSPPVDLSEFVIVEFADGKTAAFWESGEGLRKFCVSPKFVKIAAAPN